MKEITLTDQRPRTTSAEMPDHLKPLKPLAHDPVIAKLIADWKRKVADKFGPDGKERER